MRRIEREDISPVTTTSGAPLHPSGVVSDPDVVRDGGVLRFWFTGNTMAPDYELGTAYATSEDGLLWDDSFSRVEQPPPSIRLVLEPGIWDLHGVETPSVLRVGDEWHMYYTGDMDLGLRHGIGAATSSDGVTWTKVGMGPAFDASAPWEQPVDTGDPMVGLYGGVLEPTVLYDPIADKFHMWYAALGLTDGAIGWRVGYATSPDGFAWTRRAQPVLGPGAPGAWDDNIVSHVEVVPDPSGAGFHMFYFGSSKADENENPMQPGFVGHAFSDDGVSWARNPDNPVLRSSATSDTPYLTGGPAALIEGGKLRIWFFAADTAEDAAAFRFTIQAASVPFDTP